MRHFRFRILIAMFALVGGLGARAQDEVAAAVEERQAVPMPRDAQAFEAYWSKGEAELTSYVLEQSRYGEIHPGSAMLIFATEDFSRSRQVRIERPGGPAGDSTRVLKVHLVKSFNTGIYPYSLMTSAFTPLDGSGTLKVTASVQEWNGQVFSQLNRREQGLEIEVRSYFQFEGDHKATLADLELEDDLFARIRLNPASLNTGVIEILPSLAYLRLAHRPLKAYAAEAKLVPAGADGIAAYEVTYPELDRRLAIRYRAAFPFEIEGWEETYADGRGGKVLTTRAQRKERLMLDFWNHNKLSDAPLRQKLGLP